LKGTLQKPKANNREKSGLPPLQNRPALPYSLQKPLQNTILRCFVTAFYGVGPALRPKRNRRRARRKVGF
jgi:hypothetical protein